jgi:hypothetical protein
VVVMPAELLGQLEAGMVICAPQAMHDSGLFERGEVAVGGALAIDPSRATTSRSSPMTRS